MEDARAIYQANLDEVSRLLWARDWEGVLSFVGVPNEVVLADGHAVLADREATFRHLQSFRDELDRIGAEAYHRLCLGAARAPDDPDRIDGRHRTFLLRGGDHIRPPFECAMRLRRFGGTWMSIRLAVDLRNRDLAVVDERDLGPPREREGRDP